MALLNKIFNKRKLAKSSFSQTSCSSQFPTPFNSDKIRILMFSECDLKGRKLLFDSNIIEKSPLTNSTYQENMDFGCFDETRYKCGGKPSSDYKLIEEMVFGSVAVSFRGTSFKIHWLTNPHRLICSQVFFAPKQNYNSSNNASFSAASSSSRFSTSVVPESANDITSSSVSESTSLNSISISESIIAIKNNENLNDVHAALSLDNDELRFVSQMSNEDSSGYSSEPWHQKQLTSTRSSLSSIFSDLGCNSRKLSVESISEFSSEHEQLNRRILKNLSTSFENVPLTSNNSSISSLNMNSGNMYYTITGTSVNLNGMSDGWLSKVRRNSEIFVRRKTSSGDALIPASSLNQRKRSRLAIAVVVTMNENIEDAMNTFCVEHAVLFESMLDRLRFAVKTAYAHRQKNMFMLYMVRAWITISRWFNDFFSSPRVLCPLWIHLSSDTASKISQKLAVDSFLSDLIFLLNSADTKNTNFTLITAILTYHCGWVSTVAPLITPNSTFCFKSKNVQQEKSTKLSDISKNYPYNALWAQFGDLIGALTTPTRLCKTIICGNSGNVLVMNKMLNILTYFIRCSEVKRNKLNKCFDVNNINSIMKQQLKSKPQCINLSVEENTIAQKSRAAEREIKLPSTPTLIRATSTVKNLNLLDFSDKENDSKSTSFEKLDRCDANKLLSTILKKNVMNDLPTVLAFRDSRMVQQELRIGNKSMDTGLERTEKDRDFLKKYIKTSNNDDKNNNNIKLTVTKPDSDEARELSETDPMVEILDGDKKPHISQDCVHGKFDSTLERKVEFVLGEDEKLDGLKTLYPSEDRFHHSIDSSKDKFCVANSGHQECNNIGSLDFCNSCTNLIYVKDEFFGPKLNMKIQTNSTVNNLNFRDNNEHALSVIELPLLQSVKFTNQEDEMKPGFTPSLFPLTCDHYIADMILQGVTSSPGNEWEQALKRDILISSKIETAEHFAIIANLDKFEVRVASSSLMSTNTSGIGIVGMSNLIAVMLETVQAMATSGASEFQCLSLIENKFREIYQLSEALASFLLEIEFCTLNQLATSLNLSINDVPLLMSIASIHTPVIAKKCGITFR